MHLQLNFTTKNYIGCDKSFYMKYFVNKSIANTKNISELHAKNNFTATNWSTVKPRFTAPRFTANPDIPRPSPFPRIVLNICIM